MAELLLWCCRNGVMFETQCLVLVEDACHVDWLSDLVLRDI